MNSDVSLVNEFIENCNNFWNNDTNLSIDKKHEKIIKSFKDKYQNNYKKIFHQLINWEEQTDLGAPWQLNFYHLKHEGIIKSLTKIAKNIKRFVAGNSFDSLSFFDDLEVLKIKSAYDLLKKNPVHKTPFCEDFYFFEKEISANYRWMRYIYICSTIIQKKLLENSSYWLDIGSYYGGIQGILRNEINKTNFILCDFNHQLLRSYVNLKKQFPNNLHIFPNQIEESQILQKTGVGQAAFIYLPVTKFYLLNEMQLSLVSNFFSFGEMKRKTFENYFNSRVIENSKYIYTVNRFISAPFFEKTYDTDLNIFDYTNNKFEREYFDVFPIHHYAVPKRKVFNYSRKRPVSSPYFELILKNYSLNN